jgi:hypothetical protein
MRAGHGMHWGWVLPQRPGKPLSPWPPMARVLYATGPKLAALKCVLKYWSLAAAGRAGPPRPLAGVLGSRRGSSQGAGGHST